MKRNLPIRLFEQEEKLIFFAVITGVVWSMLRIAFCTPLINSRQVTDLFAVLSFYNTFIIEDIGSGFFVNTLWGGNIYFIALITGYIVKERYKEEQAYYYCRYGLRKYVKDNILSAAAFTACYYAVQIIIYYIPPCF